MCDELMELTDKKFLSTPSARRATRSRQITQALPADFYPRPPRGGRPRADCRRPTPNTYFYPRPPRGGRRLRPAPEHACGLISIHALREEGDAHKTVKENRKAYFYPRPPRGGRLTREYYYSGREQFLSTPSARRATARRRVREGFRWISIHALREEGDAARSRP